MTRIAVPKGRLWPYCAGFLEALGFDLVDAERCYTFYVPELDLEAISLKIQDIPIILNAGLVDFAIAADDWLAEADSAYEQLVTLCWYHARICLLAPTATGRASARKLGGANSRLTVATPYPRLTQRLLGGREVIDVFPVLGAVEAFPGRFTDLAVDCVESGETAWRNGLVVVADLFTCDVRLVARPGVELDGPAAVSIMSAALSRAARPDCKFAAKSSTERQLA